MALPFNLLLLLLGPLATLIPTEVNAFAIPGLMEAAPLPITEGPIPPYVLEYAPLIHLSPDELYWPSSVQNHLDHTVLRFANYSRIPSIPNPLTPQNLGFMGNYTELYLTGNKWDDDAKAGNASWLLSQYGIPDETGRSEGEVTIILVDKSEILSPGYLDAFYFTFYSYNEGNSLGGIRYGDHVGDWEHVLVRFLNGVPQQLFLSEHGWGEVWPYDGLDKGDPKGGREKRPVVYSAEGSHALYGTSGKQPYILPFGLLSDTTGPGPLWDPTLNYRSYWLNTSASTWWTQHLQFVPTTGNDHNTSYVDYAGRWGDEVWTARDLPGQYCRYGNCRYVSGPLGPRYKFLDRRVLDPIDFTWNLILTLCASLSLCVMFHGLYKRIKKGEPKNKNDPAWFRHLFPFCFIPALKASPAARPRPPLRKRAKTWYGTNEERAPLLQGSL